MGKLKVGDVLKNNYQPDIESYIIYTGKARGLLSGVWLVGGEIHLNAQFVSTAFNDRDNFPIVGHVDYKEALRELIRNEVKEQKEG